MGHSGVNEMPPSTDANTSELLCANNSGGGASPGTPPDNRGGSWAGRVCCCCAANAGSIRPDVPVWLCCESGAHGRRIGVYTAHRQLNSPSLPSPGVLPPPHGGPYPPWAGSCAGTRGGGSGGGGGGNPGGGGAGVGDRAAMGLKLPSAAVLALGGGCQSREPSVPLALPNTDTTWPLGSATDDADLSATGLRVW